MLITPVISGHVGEEPMIGAKVTRADSLTITNGDVVPIPFQSAVYDTSGFWASSPHPERITIPAGQAGYYRATIAIGVLGHLTDNVTFGLNLNSEPTSPINDFRTQVGFALCYSHASVDLHLDVGDFLFVSVESDGTLDASLIIDPPAEPVLSIQKIGV